MRPLQLIVSIALRTLPPLVVLTHITRPYLPITLCSIDHTAASQGDGRVVIPLDLVLTYITVKI